MVLELLSASEDVVVLDNLSTGFRSAVPDAVQFVEGNVGDMALVAQLLRDHSIDAFLHFAGSIVVPDSVIDPLGY
jgi:UDP-glucose 4-epimerase